MNATTWKEHLQAAPLERHEAIEQAILWMSGSRLAGPHLLEGPDPTTTARIILGAHPHELAPRLTRSEACAWARQSTHPLALLWLWVQILSRHGIENVESKPPQTFAVARWVDRCLSSSKRRPALLRQRVGGIATPIDGAAIDRLDEVQPVDLHISVSDTLRAAAHRALREGWDGENELTPALEGESRLPPGVRVLRHFNLLMREGIEMRHCVAQYAQKIHDRECVILAIGHRDERSTAELRDNEITQHVGVGNTKPPQSHVDLLAAVDRVDLLGGLLDRDA